MGSIVHLQSRNANTGESQAQFDATTGETILRLSAVILDEDFIGPGHSSIPAFGSPASGYPWVKHTQQTGGSPTVAIVANSAGGVVACALDATSEKQEATIYANDQLNWDVTKSATWEGRIAFSVLPGALVEMVFGLHSAWIDGPDNASDYVRFQALASGTINYQKKDGVQTLSYPTSTILVAGAFYNFRIDATDPTNVCFFINGVQVNTPGQINFQATGGAAIMQPYCSVYKASGAGLGTMQIDSMQLGMNRS
jgi:hypothetical protein